MLKKAVLSKLIFSRFVAYREEDRSCFALSNLPMDYRLLSQAIKEEIAERKKDRFNFFDVSCIEGTLVLSFFK